MMGVAPPSKRPALPERHADRDHHIRSLPVLVLFPHSRCNCRCVMCDIWRLRQVREITAADFGRYCDDLRALGVRWIVLSGGEPLMHSDLAALCGLLRRDGVRITILSTGILLKARARLVADSIDDVIVSLDGSPEIHDHIRNLPNAFSRLADGVKALRELRPKMAVSARCTVQKTNRTALRRTVDAARGLDLNSISFLAADVTSSAFNRPEPWSPDRQREVALDAREVDELDAEIEALIREYASEITRGFIVESAPKLRRIAIHFRAHLGQVPFVAPRCNAPWVSTVIEADGAVRPCFFHPPFGQLAGNTLRNVLNGEAAIRFRRQLNVASDSICRRCVCSLYLPEGKSAGLREPGSAGVSPGLPASSQGLRSKAGETPVLPGAIG
jgi:Fe-coproporphyrin III synthase